MTRLRRAGPALAQTGSLPQLGFSWQEVKVTTVFRNGTRQCETSIFSPACNGDIICQDRSVTVNSQGEGDALYQYRPVSQNQAERIGVRRSVSAGSKERNIGSSEISASVGSKERNAGAGSSEKRPMGRPSSSPAGQRQRKAQSRPLSGPAGNHGSPDSMTLSRQNTASAVVSGLQAACTVQSLAQVPTDHTVYHDSHLIQGSVEPPGVWDDLIYLGMVHRLPPRKDPKTWPKHHWPKIHLGLSKYAILYQINAKRATKRLCELVTGLEPANVKRLPFPNASNQQFTLEIQPTEDETFIFACDAQEFVEDWEREIRFLLDPYRERASKPGCLDRPHGVVQFENPTMSPSPGANDVATERQVQVPDITIVKARATVDPGDMALSLMPERQSSKKGAACMPLQLSFKDNSKASDSSTALSKSQLPVPDNAAAGARQGKGGSDKEGSGKSVNLKKSVLRTMTVLRDIKFMNQFKARKASTNSDDEGDAYQGIEVSEFPRIAQAHGIPLKDLDDKWKEWLVFTQGAKEIPRSRFTPFLSKYLKVPAADIPQHLLLKNLKSRRLSIVPGDTVGFEEFVLWHKTHEFDPFVAQDEEGRTLMLLAREHGLPLPDVETVKKQYDIFDTDKSGRIEFDEFVSILCALLHVKSTDDIPPERIQRYWGQLAKNDASIGFREFLPWYIQNYYGADVGGCAITQFYSSFGVNRLRASQNQ